MLHAEGQKDLIAHERSERSTSRARDGLTRDDEAEVGVVEAPARFGDDDAVVLDHVVGVRHVALVARPTGVATDVEGREAGHMLIELSDRDVADVKDRTRDRGGPQVLVDRPVEVDATLVLEDCG